jgi:peptidoglycan/xylan/chitin deacetylase (PgdA/CDA1 family)
VGARHARAFFLVGRRVDVVTPTVQPLLGASLVGTAATFGAAYWATYAVRSQWLGPTTWRGRTDNRSVALTFDDGPADDTERILETLDRFNVRAAFFMLGRQVERYPKIARMIVEAGHEVGNHSYSHPLYLYCSASRIRHELERTQTVIADTTGVRPIWSRPPCGVRSPGYFHAVARLGLRTVQWSVAGFDWRRCNPSTIAASVARGMDPGAIVLLHDGDSAGRRDRRATVQALPSIVRAAASRGLALVPLSALLGMS